MKNKDYAVWGFPVRCLHWLLVAGIAAAWTTSSRIGVAHEYIGYGVAVIIVLRIALGFAGDRYARFTGFVRSVRHTARYLTDVLHARAPRYIGHNPLGGWMVVALLINLCLVSFTGFLATTDALWGYAWPVRLHTGLAWMLVLLIALHIAGVIFSSWQHRENLIGAMLTGFKKAPQPDDID